MIEKYTHEKESDVLYFADMLVFFCRSGRL